MPISFALVHHQGFPASGTRPAAVATTWGWVRNIENRRFDALLALTYPRNYPDHTNYDVL